MEFHHDYCDLLLSDVFPSAVVSDSGVTIYTKGRSRRSDLYQCIRFPDSAFYVQPCIEHILININTSHLMPTEDSALHGPDFPMV